MKPTGEVKEDKRPRNKCCVKNESRVLKKTAARPDQNY